MGWRRSFWREIMDFAVKGEEGRIQSDAAGIQR